LDRVFDSLCAHRGDLIANLLYWRRGFRRLPTSRPMILVILGGATGEMAEDPTTVS
jgi:hypothetical protein